MADLSGTYHVGAFEDACIEADVILECTGVGQLVLDAMRCNAPDAIVCLTGISSGHRSIPMNVEALNKAMVLQNDVVFGSVNANRRHYEKAAHVLARADASWLERLVARRVPLQHWEQALERRADDVKTVIEISA